MHAIAGGSEEILRSCSSNSATLFTPPCVCARRCYAHFPCAQGPCSQSHSDRRTRCCSVKTLVFRFVRENRDLRQQFGRISRRVRVQDASGVLQRQDIPLASLCAV